MFASFVLYASLLAFAAGIVTMFRRVRIGLAICGTAVVTIALALAWPAGTMHSFGNGTRLDALMPVWQFDERHAIHVDAPPRKVFAAIHAVTAGDIRFFQALTGIRRGFTGSAESIMNAPSSAPILDVATRTTFRYLADDEPDEIVVGTRLTPDVVAMMNFHVEPDGSGSMLTTETRVHAKTKRDERLFAVYWRTILPGSDIIRRMWLRAIKRRAEA